MGETISQTTPVARKPHVCAYCNAVIPKGEKHRAWTWADEGRLYSLHAHEQCAVMANVVLFWEDDVFSPDDWSDFRSECEARWPGALSPPWQREPCASGVAPA